MIFDRPVATLFGLLLLLGCSQPTTEPSAKPQAVTTDTTDEYQPEEGFTLLTLDDFDAFMADDDTWRVEDGELITTGNPKGYIYSKQPYRNFTWRVDYQLHPKPGETDEQRKAAANTGFMIHIQDEHSIWPRSLEVQGKHVEMCSIKSNGGVPELTIKDNPAARKSARQPLTEWNSVEIVSKDGALTSLLNGTKICESEAGELTEGRIGLQAEGFEVHFRRMRIRENE